MGEEGVNQKKHIVAINFSKNIAMLDDGQYIPITNWYDGDDEVSPDEAAACVAGPCKDDQWYAADLSEFEHKTWH
jgi:hypothetical protein